MLTIKDLADSLGLSTSQVRRRLSALDGLIDNHTKRGQNQKILVDSGGLELLKRLEALREEGLSTRQAVEAIGDEMGEEEGEKRREASEKVNQKYVEQLEKRLEEKDEKIEELRRDKKWIQEKYETLEQRLITGEVENEEGKDDFKELGLIQLVKKWLTTKT